MADEVKDHCGVFAIHGDDEAAYTAYLGLYALQHRGEESCGIVTSNGKKFISHKGMGHVQDVFVPKVLKGFSGHSAIGHVRYSTTGSSNIKNAQPLHVDYSKGEVAIAHNGNLTNADLLRSTLEAYGAIFQTTTDSEIIIHLMAKPALNSIREGIVDALKRIEGAYSLVFLTHDYIAAARDPQGFRPLWIGKTPAGAWVFASETCALDLIDAELIREVEPGELVIANKDGLISEKINTGKQHAHCIFEHVYFSRPDSVIFDESVHAVRKKFGQQLAREHAVDADVVIAVPDSGNSAALGYSQESGIPLEIGIIRNHYVGRTFIQPEQQQRNFKVKIKFNLLKDVLKGKRVVVVDDSIVRGTTSKLRIKTLREAGAKEVHLRISCPPHKFPCAYGIDFPTASELLASTKTLDEIRDYLECDTLGYLSLDGMLDSVKKDKSEYCTACWSGQYPLAFDAPNKYFAENITN
ncbi:MAG: amidophosphoribosyltransferase [Candidatus Omnitrophota bacterium]|jgi:amidophosphoribosyltransferase